MWSLLPERWVVEWWRGSAVELDAHRIDALPARDQRSRERNGRMDFQSFHRYKLGQLETAACFETSDVGMSLRQLLLLAPVASHPQLRPPQSRAHAHAGAPVASHPQLRPPQSRAHAHAGNSSCSYRNGAWRHEPTLRMPYRLERGNMSERSQFVRGWKHATHSFWGLCDEQHRASTVRQSVQYKWEPASCSDGIPPLDDFSARRFCSLASRHKRVHLMFVGDSLTGQLFTSLVALLNGCASNTPPT